MKLSIITINYNNCGGLRRTLDSVRAQDSDNFEFIVVDGASTDGSARLLDDYEDIISVAISEGDSGIYNAMNKGVARATGNYCLFLNSGDILHDSGVVKDFNSFDSDANIITGIQSLVEINDGAKTVIGEVMPAETITSDLFIASSIGHGCTFIKTELLRRNPYDETLRIVSDWKFFLEELVIKQRTYTPWCRKINEFDMTGLSNTQRSAMMAEREQVLTSYIPAKILQDFRTLMEGRTPLEKIIKAERPDGRMHKILTMTANALLFFGKKLGK